MDSLNIFMKENSRDTLMKAAKIIHSNIEELSLSEKVSRTLRKYSIKYCRPSSYFIQHLTTRKTLPYATHISTWALSVQTYILVRPRLVENGTEAQVRHAQIDQLAEQTQSPSLPRTRHFICRKKRLGGSYLSRQHTLSHLVGTRGRSKNNFPGASFFEHYEHNLDFSINRSEVASPRKRSGTERLNEKRKALKFRGYQQALAYCYLTQRASRYQRLPIMNTRHEKNVQRKLRVKERKNAIARSLRLEPLRSINTCNLQILQQALGLPLDPCLLPREEAQEDNIEPEILDKGASSRAALSNFPDVPFAESPARTTSQPTIPTPAYFGSGDCDSQEPELLDVIFIAIDFEYSHYSPKTGRIRLREVGISMLDTRDLRHQNISLEDVISTQHYRTVTDTKEFLFGKSIDILQDELVLILKRLLYLEDKSPRQTRNLILVGHGFSFEIKAMKGLGLDLNLASSIIEIFDTEFLGYEVFGKNFKCSLSNVVKETGISGGFFHNAGNDANFSLRAMLLLAIYRYDILKMNGALQSRLEMYRKLAQF